jgi:hypothetical protein
MGDTISRRKALGMMTATLALPLLGCREDLFAPQPTASLASVDTGPFTLIGAGDPHAKLNNGNAERVGRNDQDDARRQSRRASLRPR